MADEERREHQDLIRQTFERAAELAARPDDAYAERWSAVHQAIGDAAAKREIDHGG